MIKKDIVDTLLKQKNLLAFSAGVDSSALFFLLIKHNIPFDIALVNYGLREESIEEENYAKELAIKYNIELYIIEAPKWQSNFEANARDFRYMFFNTIIDKERYTTLLTAHQLNDQLEWFLMRLTKGAGVSELIGLQDISVRKTKLDREYQLIRPILDISKDELIEYLDSNNYKYFIDKSNLEDKYERNRFRKDFSDKLIAKYRSGISKSFEYLKKDRSILLEGIKKIYSFKDMQIIEIKSKTLKVKATDIALKELGYLLSSKQREEIEISNSIVIGGEWAVVYQENKLYISPFLNIPMPKKYKELCRVSSMPIKIRPYAYSVGLKPIDIMGI
jgi:tRNA(Ile)-lysidine synthase